MTATSLTGKVYDALHEKKPKLAQVFGDNFVTNTQNPVEEVKLLNNYFRKVLTQAPINTLSERTCLMDDLDPETWFKYFRSHALPTLVRFNLPAE